MRCRAYTSWLPALCILSLFICFSSPTQTTSCAPVTQTGQVIGGLCTAESITTATIWNHGDKEVATHTRLLFVLVGALALAILPIVRTIASCVSTRISHMLRQLKLSRAGPSPNGMFIPCLYATHGM
ncbi:MAG: hypothetical protein P8J32_01625 [bacterium]|nr:hypothetical protein [bacterium]